MARPFRIAFRLKLSPGSRRGFFVGERFGMSSMARFGLRGLTKPLASLAEIIEPDLKVWRRASQ